MRAAAVFTLLLAGCVSAPTEFADGTTGRLVIETRTTDVDDPTRDEPATVTAWLELPERAGRVPAVVVAHGCYGEGPETDAWTSELRRMGYAALAVDSFGGRRIREVCTGQQPISVLSRVHDAYRALALLATHPRIDRERIALMGFSHGGWVALSASHAGFARLARVEGAPDFAAYLAFYPLACNVRYLNEAQRVGGPIRIFHGAEDNWTPARPCRDLTERLRAAGHDVTMVEYDGAHHGFDAPRAGASVRLLNVVNLAQCEFIQQPDRTFVTADGRPVGLDSPCVTRGATVGYNAIAHRKSVADVKAFLAEMFRRR